MKIAFISDIHANLDALEVVLADLAEQGADRIICLGDIVGYGPQPNDCVKRVREKASVTVVGNHDHAAVGLMDTLAFNEYARAAADWTAEALEAENVEYLRSLPLQLVDDGIRLVHASPLEPERWTYVLSFPEAERQFTAFEEPLCFLGHSHLPVVIERSPGAELQALQYPAEDWLSLDPECRYIVNVGSVGQPRDRDPRSAYVLYEKETHSVMLRRLAYPVESVQQKILAAGLPNFLATRLSSGV